MSPVTSVTLPHLLFQCELNDGSRASGFTFAIMEFLHPSAHVTVYRDIKLGFVILRKMTS